RGETLTDADIGEQERNVLAAGAATLVRRGEAVGQKVRRTIPAGSVLLATLLEQPVLVRRGDRINVDTVPGTISVRISAEALGTARRGERVRVRNLQSGRVIDAIVTGDGSAQAL
ncbi:MAG: flagellar basal body P-ring formation protein FlgA, partial [Pseudomonadales bacterium]|nr:flagellar basal body P-ring formation protein FlgA [Pseudomonadales bacterium]